MFTPLPVHVNCQSTGNQIPGMKILSLTIFILDTCTLANSEEPDEMLHQAAFHQGIHCLQN